MAKSKKMNEVRFSRLVKELSAIGEFILTKQNEKQSVMNSFDVERARYTKGRISETALASSSRKVNSELLRLDKAIRDTIVKVGEVSTRAKAFAAMQSPKVFRASVSGIKLISGSRKKTKKKIKKTKNKAKKTKKKVVRKAGKKK